MKNTNSNHGDNLIFLISQPRSGSTMLQHIIASHALVHTTPEPWFMLPLIYTLKPTHFSAEYNDWYAYVAFKEFLDALPNGGKYYYKQLGKFASSLYNYAMIGTGKSVFLDKTPRYYFIIPDLVKLFPKAKFILLFRNPIAVLRSILDYNFSGNWREFQKIDRYSDVCIAPRLMVDGSRLLGNRSIRVHYESLIDDPHLEIERICDFCNLEFAPDMINYGNKVNLNGSFVDNKSVYRHTSPVSHYKDSWRKGISSSQERRFVREYLDMLGKDLVEELGYSYKELSEYFSLPSPIEKLMTISWKNLVEPNDQKLMIRRVYLSCWMAIKKVNLLSVWRRLWKIIISLKQ